MKNEKAPLTALPEWRLVVFAIDQQGQAGSDVQRDEDLDQWQPWEREEDFRSQGRHSTVERDRDRSSATAVVARKIMRGWGKLIYCSGKNGKEEGVDENEAEGVREREIEGWV